MNTETWMPILGGAISILTGALAYLFKLLHEVDKKQAVTDMQISHLVKLAEELNDKLDGKQDNKARR